jgi:imidazole glycerol-phosphate synthase subunit HisH
MIGVIDYQTGNSRSVIYALRHLGHDCRLVASPDEADGVQRYILPGVGSAEVTMRSLAERGWIGHLDERIIQQGVPFLGICVGMQVLFDFSDEGQVDCLGWLPGKVRQFDPTLGRVPHMGWNEVVPASGHPLVAGLTTGHYYFVNSFFATPDLPRDSAGKTDYGVDFTSVVARNNIMGTQFHVEKSGELGLKLLNRFATLNEDDLRADQ